MSTHVQGLPRVEVVTVTPNPAIDWTLTIPGFTAGTVNRVEQQQSHPGGKGVNVAVSLANFGYGVAATGFLGEENATPFEVLFGRNGIADHFVKIAGETRVGIKVADPENQETTDINFAGPTATPADVAALSQQAKDLAASGPWVVLGGSLPPGVDATLYRELVRVFKAGGCKVVLDTSGPPLRHGLEAAPHVVKPNIHELEELVGRSLLTREAIIEAACALLRGGIELVVVSMGAEGALFVEGEQVVLARPANVKVGSTVGAGDAMVAGIVAGHLGGLSLQGVARLASAFSLHVLTRASTAVNARAGIEALVGQITISPLN